MAVAAEQFGVVVSAIDRSRAGFASVLHGARELGGRVRDAITAPLRALADPGSMALVYNIRALAGAFETLYAAQDQQRQANLKVAATLRSTGYAAGFTADQLRAMADARQAVTTYDGDEIMNAQAIMLTFKNVQGDVFREGMTLSEDLARTLDQDLKSAVLQVGKALNDPVLGVTALGRAGVQFNAVQRAQIKGFVETNQLAAAQAVILGELRSQVGGVSEAMAQGAGGQIKQIQGLMGDLVEGLANVLEPWAVTATGIIRGWLVDANSTMGEMVSTIQLKFDSIKSLAEDTFSVVGNAIRSAFGMPSDMSALEATVRGITRSVLAMAEGVMLLKMGGNIAAGTYQTAASWIRKGLGIAVAGTGGGANSPLDNWMDKNIGLSFRSLSAGFYETGDQAAKAAQAHRRELERMKAEYRNLQDDIQRVMVKAGDAVKVTFADSVRIGMRKTAEELRAFVVGTWTRSTSNMSAALANWANHAADAAKRGVKAAKEVGQSWADAGNKLRSAMSTLAGARKNWLDYQVGRNEDAAQFAMARFANNPAAQDRIRFDQAKWLATQARRNMIESPDAALGLLDKAWGNVQDLRKNFMAGGAGRQDWKQLNALAANIDQMQRDMLQQQLKAAEDAEKTARAKFDAEQRALAATQKRAQIEEQVATGSAKLAQGFDLLKGATERLVRQIGAGGGNGPAVAGPQFNAANAALDVLLGAIF